MSHSTELPTALLLLFLYCELRDTPSCNQDGRPLLGTRVSAIDVLAENHRQRKTPEKLSWVVSSSSSQHS